MLVLTSGLELRGKDWLGFAVRAGPGRFSYPLSALMYRAEFARCASLHGRELMPRNNFPSARARRASVRLLFFPACPARAPRKI